MTGTWLGEGDEWAGLQIGVATIPGVMLRGDAMEAAMKRVCPLFIVKTGCDQADPGQTVSHAEAETRRQKRLKYEGGRSLCKEP